MLNASRSAVPCCGPLQVGSGRSETPDSKRIGMKNKLDACKVMMKILSFLVFSCTAAAVAVTAMAGEADVTQTTVVRTGPGVFRFSVTVLHKDQGWDHYADRWEVLAPDGRILAVRTLYHPHVTEQPFTRDLEGVKIPADIRKVDIRAHCSVHAYGGKVESVSLP